MNPYTVLGVSPTASDAEIKKAYRALAKKYHPDVSKEVNAEVKFKEIQSAYDQIVEMRKNKTNSTNYTNYNYDDFFNRTTTNDSRFSTVYQYLSSGRYQDALNLLEMIDERNALWFYFAANAYERLGKIDLAKEFAQTCYQLEPTNTIYRSYYARLFSDGKVYDNSYSFFSSLFWKIILFIAIQWFLAMFLGF